MDNINILINRLENDGEEKVHRYLISGFYDDEPQTKHIVNRWLSSKENERSEKRMNEQLSVSISAKHAAWVAAIAALIIALFAITAWIW